MSVREIRNLVQHWRTIDKLSFQKCADRLNAIGEITAYGKRWTGNNLWFFCKRPLKAWEI